MTLIIESLGNVYITGSVYKAKISATGSIHIKGNIVASELYSGQFGVIFNRLYLNSKKLYTLFQEITEAAKILIRISEAKGKTLQLGQVFTILMEHKFKDTIPTIKEVLSCVKSIQNIKATDLVELRNKLQVFLSPISLLELNSFNYVYSVQNSLCENYELIERTQENHVSIDISQCHLSNLKSNGDTLIRKDGVLQSHIYSKENIIFYHNKAVCRGSQLEAGGTISAMKVGGETGGETILKAGKKITLQLMNTGRVGIGRFFKDILEPLEHVIISANNDGIIIKKDD